MHGQGFFFQAFVYLAAAVVSVPIAKRAGLGSVLGYLLAGAAIGPFGLALVGEEGQDVMHFAEFGVVMMLFLVGLELEPSRVWRMRSPILGLGGLQVGVTSLAIAGIGLAAGLRPGAALAVGMTLALSSTAIVIQTLNEKGLMKTSGGQSGFAVLLFQDLAVIPMLALFPLLAPTGARGSAGGHAAGTAWVDTLPAWERTLVVLGAVALVVLAGRFLVRPAFRFIAGARLREVFTAAGLLLVIGTALLMASVGLSPALGAFVAGVVLANSEYRHELESDIEPFKGLLLGVFFIAVGASIDFALVGARPGLVIGMVIGLAVLKLVLLLVLGRVFGLRLDQNLLFGFALAQGGEFAFVLFSFALQNGVLEPATVAPLVAVVALTMALTPLLVLVNERLLLPRFGTRERAEREPDAIDEDRPVILAGFGRFGNAVGRLLTANGIGTTILDNDSDRVDLLRRMGLEVFYGDATRADLLEAAGAARARILVLALDDPDKNLSLVHTAKAQFPHLTLVARANGWRDAYDLIDAGVEHVFRETLDSSLRLGVETLRLLGVRAHRAYRAAQMFRRHDEESIRQLAGVRHDERRYVDTAKERIRHLEAVLRADAEDRRDADAGWDAESLRREFGGEPPSR